MGEKKFLYYIFIITITITGLISYFVTFPISKRIDDAKNEIQQKHAEVEQLKDKEGKLKKLDKDYRTFQDKIDMVTKMFPKLKEISGYLTQVENATFLSGIGIKSIKVSGESQKNTKEQPPPQYTQLTKSGDYYEFPIDICVVSFDFTSLLNFIKTTEKLSRFTSIKKITIKPAENDAGLESTISLTIYVLP